VGLVAAAGVPHAPYLPALVAEEGPAHRVAALFGRVAGELREAAPDTLLIVSPDHFVNFFFDNLPTFAVGLADRYDGPHETSGAGPWREAAGDPDLARALLRGCLEAGFDLSRCLDARLDHGFTVPLGFLAPSADLRLVPLWVNTAAEPLPSAARCFALGRALGGTLEGEGRRVALVASGAFSVEIGGPRMGEADEAWLEEAAGLIREGRCEELVRRATPERFAAAGTESAELLAWIVVLGAVGGRLPAFVETDVRVRHSREAACYAAWRLG
jgi:aromatic ring-opening dioxygenase catalytic subunit (LigB family)